jgi:ribonucleoside-diphosphate reductase alpha chain
MHNIEYVRPFSSVNPCGEQILSVNNVCNLSSIVLPSFVNNGVFDFDKFKNIIRVAVRFADDVIDNCTFPIPKIKERAFEERRVGIGTIGVHDMLMEVGLGYDTNEGRAYVDNILRVFRDEAYKTSIDLAKEKGAFPLFDKEKYMESGFIKTLPSDISKQIALYGIRNSTVLTQPPTGTTGTMYNLSTGCEPWPFLLLQRNTRLGSYEDGCPTYIKWRKDNPTAKISSYFKTAQEIIPEDHVKMMALFSRYVDSAVSKTINLPGSATPEDISKAFLMAMDMGIKGLTVFRDGSKEGIFVNKDVKDKIAIEEVQKTVHKLMEEKQDLKMDDVVEDTRMAPKKRGNRAVGATYRVHMQGHNLYITANRNAGGELVELFATVGESKNPDAYHTSGVEDSWAEGLGKMISLALRAGVSPSSIIRNLKNIPSDKPVFINIDDEGPSELVPSPPHAIARVMEEELKYTNANQKKVEPEFTRKGNCASCGSDNIKFKSPICYECLDCAFSFCG